MKLKSFGCSFIQGSDLSDYDPLNGSTQTWPARLAENLGFEYQCWASAGCGNLRIAEQVLKQLYINDQALYVISWTWIDRFDYISVPHIKYKHSEWQTLRPADPDPLAVNYFAQLQSEYKDKLTSLIYVKSVVDMLHQKKQPFVMTYIDPLLLDQTWNNSSVTASLQNFLRPYFTMFEDMTFLEWSRQKGYEISPKLHPLETAHKAAANYMITNLPTATANMLHVS